MKLILQSLSISFSKHYLSFSKIIHNIIRLSQSQTIILREYIFLL